MKTLMKVAALLGVLLAACLVPTVDELEQEKARLCDAERPCLPGYGCVEEHCQPEQGTACRPGATADCGQDRGECQPGQRKCGEDGTYGPCEGALVPPAAEVCNGLDDDCDGTADEELSCGDAGTDAGTNVGTDAGTGTRPNGESCTGDGMCASGFCVAGICCNSACNAPPMCRSAGTCGTGTCVYPVAANQACDDGNKCTDADKCNASGTCAGMPRTCNSSPGQCHASTGTCSGLTGLCEYAYLPTTTSCNDNNACTLDDRCNGSGTCVAGTTKTCSDTSDVCYKPTGTCNTSTGACEYQPQPRFTPCDDGSGCTNNDSCNGSGLCRGTNACADHETCINNVCTCGTGGQICLK